MSACTDPDPANTIPAVLLTAILLLLGALVRAGKEAILLCKDGDLRRFAEEGDKKARRILSLTEASDRFLDRVQTADDGFTVLTLLCATVGLWPAAWQLVASWTASSALQGLLVAVMVLIVAMLLLVFGVRLPQRLAAHGREKTAYALLPFVECAAWIATPFSATASALTHVLLRLCGMDPHADVEVVTEEEILLMVDAGEEKGVIEESQKEMINNIFEFDDLAASDVMTHRTDMIAVDVNDSIDDVIRLAIEEGCSRIPAYEGDIDDIKGILYVKDLLKYVGSSLPAEGLTGLLREPYFVPESKRCGDLFAEMTEKRVQMAIVSDEYGGTAGLVTMEDLLESIVGNIQDEYDEETEDDIVVIDETTFTVDGTADIDEVSEQLGVALPEGDYDTVGGMMLSELGRIPEEGEHPSVEAAGFRFTVEEMSERRIERVKVERLPESAGE